ncbi:TPA: hypothetical protein LA742_001774 [Clostridium botulinum]|nr:hypothetical protein [Clostridium botulinum]
MLKINDKIGMLTLIKKEKREDKKWYWLCECDCGNTKWIRADSLTKKNPTKSCGCLSEKTQFKWVDITGERFNNLTAIKYIGEGRYHDEKWKCRCDCGETITLTKGQLYSHNVKSCGCRNYEIRIRNSKRALERLKEIDLVEGTKISNITRKKPIRSNSSGVTGVHYDSTREKWAAQIEFKGVHYNLKRWDSKEEAIAARKEAERKMFGNFLEWYRKEYKK